MSKWFIHNGTDVPYAPEKDPNSEVPYGVAWDAFLGDGESIQTSEWIVPDGLTSANEYTNSTQTVRGETYTRCNVIVLSGGVAGEEYEVTNRIASTPSGWREDRSFKVKVREK